MPTPNQSDVVRRYYHTDEFLRIHEQTYETYTVPQADRMGWILDKIDWSKVDTVLDIGTGRGTYYARLKATNPSIAYYANDLSHHMLHNHPAAAHQLSRSDAMHLPYAPNSFDIVMANHMLYHVPDIEAAIMEIKRVLKPDGVILTATESIHTLPELQVLMRRAIVLLTRYGATQVHPPALPSDTFALENGTRMLSRHFFGVVRHDIPRQLVFHESEPAMQYLESMRDLRQDSLPDDVDWEDMMLIMRQQITQLMKHLGKIEVNQISGTLIASDRGGFIREFVEISNATS
jgi:ubiquinone/menaquinone biosynthesis C-methylase UbiE